MMARLIITAILCGLGFSSLNAQDLNFEEIGSTEIQDPMSFALSYKNIGNKGFIMAYCETNDQLKLTNQIYVLTIDDNMANNTYQFEMEGKTSEAQTSSYFSEEMNKMFLFVNRPKLSDDLVAFDLSTKKFESIKLSLPNNFENTLQPEFRIVKIKGQPYFLATDGSETFLAKLDFEAKIMEKVVLPAIFKTKKVESIIHLDKTRFLVTYNYKSKASNMAIINSDMEVLVEEVFTLGNKKSTLTFPSTSILPLDGDIYIYGSYNKDENYGCSGFFLTRLRKDKLIFSELYAFKQFEHFFDYVSKEKDKESFKKAAQKESFSIQDNALFIKPLMVIMDDERTLFNAFLYSSNYRNSNWSKEVKSNSNALFYFKFENNTGKILNDESIIIESENSLCNFEIDTANVGGTTYYFKTNEEFSSATYQDEELSKGDKFKLERILKKNETIAEFGSVKHWYGDYYTCVTSVGKDTNKTYQLKKLKLIKE